MVLTNTITEPQRIRFVGMGQILAEWRSLFLTPWDLADGKEFPKQQK